MSTQAPKPRSLPPEPVEPGTAEKPDPRTTASLRLTEQARLLIESKKPDQAVRTLERAINIDPGNGQNYYYLSEAWLMKGNAGQALSFNRLAEVYLEKDAVWMMKVRKQRERIEASP